MKAALEQENITVRMSATDQLSDRIGDKAVEPIKQLLVNKETTARQYVHGLWTLYRLQALTPELIQQSASHENAMIRLHAMRIIGEEKADNEKLYPIVTMVWIL